MLTNGEQLNAQACADYPCFMNIDVEDIADLPALTVVLEFHFVESNGINFQCEDPEEDDYALTYINQLLNLANDYFENPAQSNRTSAP